MSASSTHRMPSFGHVIAVAAIGSIALVGSLAAVAMNAAASVPTIGTTALVSAHLPAGGNADSAVSAISSNGRFVAFGSTATTLTSSDSHGHRQIFRRDTLTGEIVLVSVNLTDGTGVNNDTQSPSISADGRFVSYLTAATDAVTEDTGGHIQAFVRDLTTSTTILASVSQTATPVGASDDVLQAVISADAHDIAFTTAASNLTSVSTHGYSQVFERDVTAHATSMISLSDAGIPSGGAGDCVAGLAISNDGSRIAFASAATDLTPFATHKFRQIYVRDTTASATTLVSLDRTGSSGADGDSVGVAISENGIVSFSSSATDLTTIATGGHQQVYRRDVGAGSTTLLSRSTATTPSGGDSDAGGIDISISNDGGLVTFSSTATDLTDPPQAGHAQVYSAGLSGAPVVLSRRVGSTAAGGDDNSFGAVVSADGSTVTFTSAANDVSSTSSNGYLQVYAEKVTTGTTVMMSTDQAANAMGGGNADSVQSFVSQNGRFVAFNSNATDLVVVATASHRQGYLRDQSTGVTILVTAAAGSVDGANSDSEVTSISADGRYVVFESGATDLTAVPSGGHSQIYVRDTVLNMTSLASVAGVGVVTPTGANGDSQFGEISADGSHLVFDSKATDLTSDATGGYAQVFVRDLVSGSTRLVSTSIAAAATGMNADAGGAPSISGDGGLVVFATLASDVTNIAPGASSQVYVADAAGGRARLLSTAPGSSSTAGDGDSVLPVISADGTTVAFTSRAHLTSTANGGHAEVYLERLASSEPQMISLDPAGTRAADADAVATSVSVNGDYVLVLSGAGNLSTKPPSGKSQAYRWSAIAHALELVSVDAAGAAGALDTVIGTLSADGLHATMTSFAPLTGEPSTHLQVFERSLAVAVPPSTPTPTETPTPTTTSQPPVPGGGTGGGSGATGGSGSGGSGLGGSGSDGSGAGGSGGALAQTGLDVAPVAAGGLVAVVAGLTIATFGILRRRTLSPRATPRSGGSARR
ncbi:hypothetical protein [Subtercola sp. RTI3]|uniref:hypothetical protein n=1 Tax=Subtercola sp. RTI3 TaxID=3048639 RepID=UPI002B23BCB1|nr:hypothetical protein [Subtercola sp. RTI3]MEA9985930.1 hypothetical protein [Subtercola sp. RTI3]